MSSLTQLLETLSTDFKQRGNQFEQIASWFLLNDPAWTTNTIYELTLSMNYGYSA